MMCGAVLLDIYNIMNSVNLYIGIFQRGDESVQTPTVIVGCCLFYKCK